MSQNETEPNLDHLQKTDKLCHTVPYMATLALPLPIKENPHSYGTCDTEALEPTYHLILTYY